MPALSAEISEFTTRGTLPPARKCPSSSLTLSEMPALWPLISGNTMARGSTRRNRMPKSVRKETRTPENRAVSHRPNGMNRKKMTKAMMAMKTSASTIPRLTIESSTKSPDFERWAGSARSLLNYPLHHVTVPFAPDHPDSASLAQVLAFGDDVHPLAGDGGGAGGSQVGHGDAVLSHQVGPRQGRDIPPRPP